MPELPEVETIRLGLVSRIQGKKINRVDIQLPKIVPSDHTEFMATLTGARITNLHRQGKLLIGELDSSPLRLLIHLKMTGQLIYRRAGEQIAGGHPWPPYNDELPNKYTHLMLGFEDGGVLYFNDQRQFGYMKLAAQDEVADIKDKYGIEPLRSEFTPEAFQAALQNRQTVIKAVLLNQQIFSGIGNIYADEICFDAAVRPDRRVTTLSAAETNQLYHSTQKIIAAAIEHRGTTIHDYADAHGKRGNYADLLMAYAQEGQTCQRCHQGIIQKTKVAGRGTHFCPHCQH